VDTITAEAVEDAEPEEAVEYVEAVETVQVVEAEPEVSSILAPITVTLEVPVTTTKISQLPMVVRSTVPL
jgi:hypothetical protein